MIGVNLDNIEKFIKYNNLYFDSLNNNVLNFYKSIENLNDCYSGNSISYVFSNFKEQMSNMDKLCKVVKAYSEVLNNVKDAYVNQDLNVINLINNTNSTFKEGN